MWRLFTITAVGCVAAGGLASGCRDRPDATRFTCECTFLTDTDDVSTQKVQICETSVDRANSAARGCAQSGAPAAVQTCRCAGSEASVKCRVGDCAVSEHR